MASDMHAALLRPAVIQILKAAGFSIAKPAVIDSLTDLTARYLLVLAQETIAGMTSNGDRVVPTIQDVRLALTTVGALRPQMSAAEEAARDWETGYGRSIPFEDMRGTHNFVAWAQGPVNREIRRISGLSGEVDNIADLAAGLEENEDYITVLKKKHGKSAEESRYQGTVLGKQGDLQPVSIAGGPVSTLTQWGVRHETSLASKQSVTAASSAVSSALSTPAAATPDAT